MTYKKEYPKQPPSSFTREPAPLMAPITISRDTETVCSVLAALLLGGVAAAVVGAAVASANKTQGGGTRKPAPQSGQPPRQKALEVPKGKPREYLIYPPGKPLKDTVSGSGKPMTGPAGRARRQAATPYRVVIFAIAALVLAAGIAVAYSSLARSLEEVPRQHRATTYSY